jgi:hypothetical protein
MDILEEHVPAAVLILTGGVERDFASAVYKQFTSGTAPPWFEAMPTDVQSFVVLDYLPNILNEPMTLDMLALASPAARPAATAESTATSTSMPPTTYTESTHDHASRIDVAMVVGTVIPVTCLALILGFALWLIRRRKTRRAKRTANTLFPADPERAMRRWSETTFDTALQPQYQQNQSSISPPMAMQSPTRLSQPLRRALSESDLVDPSRAEAKAINRKSAASQDDRAELEAITSPLVRC